MFFGKDDRPEVKIEARDVMILKFGKDGRGDLVSADGAIVPNEVGVQVDGRPVGRAILHTREDGIHADILLERGSLAGMDATAIASVKGFSVENNVRTITHYEITGVGLTPETPQVQDANKDTIQKTERSENEQEPRV